MEYQVNCTECGGDRLPLLERCIESERTVTRRTFMRHVDHASLRSLERRLGYEGHWKRGLTMAADSNVSYHLSVWGERACAFFTWSGIEYVFFAD